MRTGPDGRFQLTVRAQSNTTYRARAAGTQSPGTNVRVSPSPTYRLVLAGRRLTRALIRYELPPGAPVAHVRVYLYTGTDTSSHLLRAGSAMLEQTGPHEAGVAIEYDHPAPDRRVDLVACTRRPISPAYDVEDFRGECGVVQDLTSER